MKCPLFAFKQVFNIKQIMQKWIKINHKIHVYHHAYPKITHRQGLVDVKIDDAFSQSELGWSVFGVVGPDLDCWRAGLQAPGSFGLR